VPIWVEPENIAISECARCGKQTEVWNIYIQGDGYLSTCEADLVALISTGLIKPNRIGKIRTYNDEMLKLRASDKSKYISWAADYFCPKCEAITRFIGVTFWEKDLNHNFQGKCKSCESDVNQGIQNLVSQTNDFKKRKTNVI
jgi:hypothetical protein